MQVHGGRSTKHSGKLEKTNKKGLGKQFVFRHVKAHVTGESRRHMKGRVKYNAGGHEKADELATGCRHLQ